MVAGDQPAGVSQETPGRPPAAALVEALRVKRNAAVGFAVGLGFALVVFAFFVAIPLLDPAVPARDRPVYLWVMLGFVVTVTAGMLVTTALVVGRAVRLARED